MLKRCPGIVHNMRWMYTEVIKQLPNVCRSYSSSENASQRLNMSVNGVCLDNYIQELERQYNSNSSNTVKLKPIVLILKNRRNIVEQMSNLHELLNDENVDIAKLALEEKASYVNDLESIDNSLLDAVLEFCWKEREMGAASMILEVSAGVGGQEAMLFASELFEMYVRFIEYKDWDHYVAEEQRTDLGGVRFGSIIIQDADAFQWLQYEAGVHRVQRIPATERAGRVHTSTVSVVALPQPTDAQVHINPNDLKIETKRASGAGGQHVNTTDSAVRIVHLPTGLAVECQTDRSQIRNKRLALQRLRTKLYELQVRTQVAQTQTIKSAQVPSNQRNHKIRTYNYSQDRVTDHRLQCTVHNLRTFMVGAQPLANLIDSLRHNSRREALVNAATANAISITRGRN